MVMISAIPRVKGPAETLGSSFNACKVVGIASPIKQAVVKVKTKEPPITKAALIFCFQIKTETATAAPLADQVI